MNSLDKTVPVSTTSESTIPVEGGYKRLVSRIHLAMRINAFCWMCGVGIGQALLCGAVQPVPAAIVVVIIITTVVAIGRCVERFLFLIDGPLAGLLNGETPPTPEIMASARRRILMVPWARSATASVVGTALVFCCARLLQWFHVLQNPRYDLIYAAAYAVPAAAITLLLSVRLAAQPYRNALFVGADMSQFNSWWLLDARKRMLILLFLAGYLLIMFEELMLQVNNTAGSARLIAELPYLLSGYVAFGIGLLAVVSVLALKPDQVEGTFWKDPNALSALTPAYQIQEKIGEGGMGMVFKGRHKLLNKTVCIKMLSPSLIGSMEALQRFRLEALATGRLVHPNIVSVIDFGILPGGRCYIVMEYVEGTALSTKLRTDGPIPFQEAVPIFIQICNALQCAHDAGVLHRDLKPANIMLAGSHVKLLDFGIAKFVNPTEDTPQLTRTGEIFGTPSYMSPEQCTNTELDARSDVYSLGCLMYETLTGKPPFTGETPVATMFQQMSAAPPVIPAHIGVPSALEQLINMTLKKNRNQRIGSMREVADALGQISTSVTGAQA